jgi:hypothetical protein
MATTQNNIQALINQIQAAANYPASKMNPLLTDILSAAYGPLYVGDIPPSNTDDENDGYRPGSVGYDNSAERFYICESALPGNASWILIPADASFTIVNFKASTTNTSVSTNVNTSIVKVTNASILNTGNSIKLPDSPYIGKTVIIYFANAINIFSIRNSEGVLVNGASALSIPLGQQYTFTYSGTAWEIVGVNNTTAGSPSGVDASNSGGTVVTNVSNLKFLGTAVTVSNAGSGVADITISPLTGLDIKEGGTTTKASAQFLNFNANNFNVAVNGTGADVDYVSTFNLFRAASSTPLGPVKGIRFTGAAFDWSAPIVTIGTADTAVINFQGFKTFLGDPDAAYQPTPANGVGESYSNGSLGTFLNRVYVCTDNNDDGATWIRIADDNGIETFNGASNTTDAINASTGYVIINDNNTGIATYTIQLASFAYVGKVVDIYIGRDIFSSFKVINPNNTIILNRTYTGTVVSKESSFSFICTSTASQGQWSRIR